MVAATRPVDRSSIHPPSAVAKAGKMSVRNRLMPPFAGTDIVLVPRLVPFCLMTVADTVDAVLSTLAIDRIE